MHRHPPRAFYTHYYNSYILKFGVERYTNIMYFKRGKNSLKLQFQWLRKNMLAQTACDEPSKEHEDGSSCGPEDNLLDR